MLIKVVIVHFRSGEMFVNIYQIQINLALSILLIILSIHAYFRMNRKNVTNKLFMSIMGGILLLLILEVCDVILNHVSSNRWIDIHRFINVIGFGIAPFILFMGYLFKLNWLNLYRKEKINPNRLLVIPLVINAIVAILSFKWGFLFDINTSNLYERGPWFFILPSVSYFFFANNIYFIYKHRRMFSASEIIIFGSFNIVPALFTSIQLIFPFVLTTWSSAAIIVVVIYIFILNDQLYKDSLTGLENRLAYEHYAQNMETKKLNKLSIVFLDLDNLKIINDQFGHQEGDEALKNFANLLSDGFSLSERKFIRLGGDEFLILLEERRRENLEIYINDFIERVEDYNMFSLKPYRIEFSYGLVKYNNDADIHQLLKRADQLMYQHKQHRKHIVNECEKPL